MSKARAGVTKTTSTYNSPAWKVGCQQQTDTAAVYRQNIRTEVGLPPWLMGASQLPASVKFKPSDYNTPVGYFFTTQRTVKKQLPYGCG